MKTSSLILAVLVVIATSSPTVALAEIEREHDDGGGAGGRIFGLTLYVVVFAIAGVVGYSMWKAYRIRAVRRKA
ncbi:MAG: hypothetical protein KGI33_03380 [Thaumarchaeota archaeon]|nr:hypothetical protein [Nitrososphaerota archaeon]